MSYTNCRQDGHTKHCNGYVGPLDTYACLCLCHFDDCLCVGRKHHATCPLAEEAGP